jgi:hypothetical protein
MLLQYGISLLFEPTTNSLTPMSVASGVKIDGQQAHPLIHAYGVSDFVSVPVTKVLGPFTEKIGAFCVGVFGRVAVGNSSR